MQFKNALNVATRFVGRTKLKLAHSSPTILTVVGVGSLIAAAVYAAKQTPKMDAVIDDLQENLKTVTRDNLYPDDETEEIAKAGVYVGFAVETLKVYGLPIALGIGGTVAILYSHGIMRKREASLVAAYGVLERAYNAYRDRVRESFGPDLENDIHRGMVIKDKKVNEKEGTVTYTPVPSNNVPDDYVRDFGYGNKHWNTARPEWNLTFLRGQEKYANHLLQTRGHIFLNEVLENLGYEHTRAGAVTGWTKVGPDGAVDFGLPEPGSPEEQDYFYFFNGNTEIRLDFNVDGLIINQL